MLVTGIMAMATDVQGGITNAMTERVITALVTEINIMIAMTVTTGTTGITTEDTTAIDQIKNPEALPDFLFVFRMFIFLLRQ